MTHPRRSPGGSSVDETSRSYASTSRKALALILLIKLAKTVTGCGPTTVDNSPFGTVVTFDAGRDNDAADAHMDTAQLDAPADKPLDAGGDDASDATPEIVVPTMDLPGTDSADVNVPEAPVDIGIEAGTDAWVETGSDTGNDMNVDATPDTESDAVADAGTDVETDIVADAESDAGTDAAIDSGSDAGTTTDTDATADASTDSGADVPSDAEADARTDAAVDAGTDATVDAGAITTRITYTDTGSATCTRIIVVGIPGCTAVYPGECTYSRASGRRLQYVIDTVSLPRSATRVEYSFYQILSGTPRQVFTTPQTPEITPTISNGLYEVSVGIIVNGTPPPSTSICRGPFVRVSN